MELEYTKIRVVDFDLKELVVLPREIDLNEWLASNSEYQRGPCSQAWPVRTGRACTYAAITAVV